MHKQLTLEQRYTISNGRKMGLKVEEIAELIGKDRSTVYRELNRNATKTGKYNPVHAQELARENKAVSARNRRTKSGLRHKVLSLLVNEQWAPMQISGWLKKEGHYISHETIYKWIRKDKKEGGSLYTHCRHKLKHRSRGVYKNASAKHIPNRVSIHDRPAEANGLRFGDFEMDTIVAKGRKSAILTIVERSTNMCFIQKIKNGFSPEDTARAAISLLLPYRDYVRSITTDNAEKIYSSIN